MLATSIISPQRHAGLSVEPGTSRRSNIDIACPVRKCWDRQARFLKATLSDARVSLAWSASFSCFGYFNEVTGVDIIDVAVNRNMLSDERMLTDTAYVLSYA